MEDWAKGQAPLTSGHPLDCHMDICTDRNSGARKLGFWFDAGRNGGSEASFPYQYGEIGLSICSILASIIRIRHFRRGTSRFRILIRERCR